MDTSKHVFQLHGVNAAEMPILRKMLRRKEMVTFFEKHAPTVIAIEACKRCQRGSGDQDDRPAAVMVGDVAAIEDEADARDRLHKPKPCQIERIMRQLVDLETQ